MAALFYAFPLFLLDSSGDKYVHIHYLECFFQNLEQGMFFPRWCGNVNNSLGAPIFVVYFPVSYYLTSLFYPLGISLSHLLSLSMLLSILVSGITCYCWLKEIFPAKAAFFSALLYLFLPYHMELAFYRFALTEAWFLAFFPLLLLLAHRWDEQLLFPLLFALCLAVCLLTHLPVALIAAFGIGLYQCLLCCKSKSRCNILLYALACTAAALIAAYHIFPAAYFHLVTFRPIVPDEGWPNRHMQLNDFLQRAAPLGTVITLLMLAWFGACYRSCRQHPENLLLQHELVAWVIVFGVSLFFFSPLSLFLYGTFPILYSFFFPWRMQLLWMVLACFLFSMLAAFLPPERKPLFYNNALAGSVLLLFLGLAFVNSVTLAEEWLMPEHILFSQTEFQSRWTDDAHYSPDYIHALPKDFFTEIHGKSESTLLSYDHASVLSFVTLCRSKQCTIRLRMFYYPLWQAPMGITLMPEASSGLTIVDLPQGRHTINLRINIYNAASPWWVRISPWISAASLIAWLTAFLYTRRHVPHSATTKNRLS